jgi:hypothetical protein
MLYPWVLRNVVVNQSHRGRKVRRKGNRSAQNSPLTFKSLSLICRLISDMQLITWQWICFCYGKLVVTDWNRPGNAQHLESRELHTLGEKRDKCLRSADTGRKNVTFEVLTSLQRLLSSRIRRRVIEITPTFRGNLLSPSSERMVQAESSVMLTRLYRLESVAF